MLIIIEIYLKWNYLETSEIFSVAIARHNCFWNTHTIQIMFRLRCNGLLPSSGHRNQDKISALVLAEILSLICLNSSWPLFRLLSSLLLTGRLQDTSSSTNLTTSAILSLGRHKFPGHYTVGFTDLRNRRKDYTSITAETKMKAILITLADFFVLGQLYAGCINIRQYLSGSLISSLL